MKPQIAAFGVHVFTALGAALAMLAMLAAMQQDWALMSIWLAAAFVVDGIDGPLARKMHVAHNAPQIDGVLLDLIIDFLTYVFIPAFALYASGLLPGWSGWFVVLVLPIASALYFSDKRMKMPDNSFRGFPGCWNMVVLTFLVLTPPWWVIFTLVIVLGVAMFLPVAFVHPVRTDRWRPISLAAIAIWTAGIAFAATADFSPGPGVTIAVGVSAAYLLLAGLVQQIFPSAAAVGEPKA